MTKNNMGAGYLDTFKIKKFLDWSLAYSQGYPMANIVGWSSLEQDSSFVYDVRVSDIPGFAKLTFVAFYQVAGATDQSPHDIYFTLKNSSGTAVTATSVTRTSVTKPFKFRKVGGYDPELYDYNENYWESYVDIREVSFNVSISQLNSDMLLEVSFSPCYYFRGSASPYIRHNNCRILNTLIYSSGGYSYNAINNPVLPAGYSHLNQNNLYANLMYMQINNGGKMTKLNSLYTSYSGVVYEVTDNLNNFNNIKTPFTNFMDGLLDINIGAKTYIDGINLVRLDAVNDINRKYRKENDNDGNGANLITSDSVKNGTTKSSISLKYWEAAETKRGKIDGTYTHLETLYLDNSSAKFGLNKSRGITHITFNPFTLLKEMFYRTATNSASAPILAVSGDPVNPWILQAAERLFQTSFKYYEVPVLFKRPEKDLSFYAPLTIEGSYQETIQLPFFFQPYNRFDIATIDQFRDLAYTESTRIPPMTFKGVNYNEL